MSLFAGLDRGASARAVCVLDDQGTVLACFEAKHDAAGLADPLARPKRIAPPDALPVAVERPSGLVVGTLLAAGHPVVPIHPDAVKACRPRHRAAGGRSDPGAAAIFADVDSPIALAFLARLPTPESARRLGPSRMRAFMAQHRCCGRRSAEERLARLRAAPQGLAGEAEADAKGEMVLALVRALGPLVAAIRDLSSRVEHATADLPDGRIVMSFPRTGRICAAQILAELGDVRERFGTDAQLAAEAGVCPSPSSLGPTALQRRPHASGKSRGVVFRWTRNHRLRAAVTRFADSSRPAPPRAADIHRRARGRGCDHAHAIRVLARAWLRVLWRAWIDRTPYDPARHNAAQALARAA